MITINGMRESTFGKMISQYAPEELKDCLFSDLRVFIEPNGQFWFIGSEVASIMGYSNTRDAILRHVPEQYKRTINRSDNTLTVVNPDGQRGGAQSIVLICEQALYALAIRSNLPQAFKFQDWVYNVISKIRQYGGYISPDPRLKYVVDVIPQYLRSVFDNMRDKINDMQFKVDVYDRAMDSSKVTAMSVIAKDFGMTPNELHTLLSKLHIIYRVLDTWVLYKQYQGQGYTASKSTTSMTD